MFEPGKVYRFNAVKSFRHYDLAKNNIADFVLKTQYKYIKHHEFTVSKKTHVVHIPFGSISFSIFPEDCDVK